MVTVATAPGLLAIAIPALLFLYLVWRQDWEWIGLYVALSFGINAWINCDAMLANLWEPSALHREPLGSAITGSVMFLGGLVCAMMGPSPLRTLFFALAAMETLFAGVVPIYRFAFDLDQGAYFAFNGQDVPNAIGFAFTVLLAVVPMMIGIPWMLARQSASEKTIIASALSRYGQLSGIGVVAFMTLSTCFVAWGYIGRGPFSGEPQRPAFEMAQSLVGPNMIFGMLMGVIIYLFWSFPKRFFDPVVDLLEASQNINSGRLEDIAHPLWRGLARTLDRRREEARQSKLIAEEARAQLIGFFDNLPTSVYLKKVDNTVVYVSRHLAEQYGKRPEEMVGQKEYDLHVDAMRPLLKMMDERILATGEAFLTEATHLQFNRQELVSRFPIFNDKGEITHIGGMNFDIDDRAKAQAALIESKALFEAFVENAPNPLILLDINGQYIMTNKAANTYFGLTQDEFLSAGIEAANERFPEMGTGEFRSMYERVLATRQFEDVETPFIMPSGETHWLRLAAFPILGPDGEVLYLGNIAHDITEVRQAQAALQESKALLDAFIQNAPNSMVLMKPNGQYVMINNAAARFYDKTPEELLAAGPKLLNAPFTEARSRIVPMMARVIANVKEETIETPFILPSGEVRDTEFMLFPILGADGEVAYVGNISHDVTAERRAQAELAKSTNALHQSEKLAALGSMLAGVSHELNNPLAAVIGQAALLGEDLEGTEHADRVSKIKRAADRCARIVQSFLAMARQRAPEYRSVEINDQIRAAVELTEYQMRAANVVLDLHLQDGLTAIDADPDQLHQVIVNLLTNARQALEECSGERTITIKTSGKGQHLKLTIADNGKGIDAATRERIFDPFFTTKDVGSGTGIGLSYSLGIIEAHGGTLTLEHAEIGTVFAITLPASRKDKGSVTTEPVTQTKAKGRALVIDDEEDVADTLADMLKRMGMDAVAAIGGRAGQAAMAGDAAFDIILSDIRMPDLDGPALFAWIADNRPDLAEKVAFVTGDTLSGHAADFLERSSCPVLEKPFTPAALRALVTQMLENGPLQL